MTAAGLHRAGAWVSTGPRGFLPCRRDRAAAGHGAWGRAVRRCQAVTIASAHGQVAAIFRRRRWAPRTNRAAAWKLPDNAGSWARPWLGSDSVPARPGAAGCKPTRHDPWQGACSHRGSPKKGSAGPPNVAPAAPAPRGPAVHSRAMQRISGTTADVTGRTGHSRSAGPADPGASMTVARPAQAGSRRRR